jgi:hypothetical protein
MKTSPGVQLVSTSIGGVASASANEEAVQVAWPAISCGDIPSASETSTSGRVDARLVLGTVGQRYGDAQAQPKRTRMR